MNDPFVFLFCSQRPMQLKGHDRPLSYVTFNKESDLLFTCGKEGVINVWFTTNGERLGTFQHEGAVLGCAVTNDSKTMISASADRSMRMWDTYTGAEKVCYNYDAVVRSVAFSTKDDLFAVTVNKAVKKNSSCMIYSTEE